MNAPARILVDRGIADFSAIPAPRPLCIRCEAIAGPEELARHEAAIEMLYAGALFGSPAFSYPVFRAALNNLGAAEQAPNIVTVWRDYENASPILIGLFAYSIDRHRWGFPIPAVRIWTHLFEFLGAPLVHKDHAQDAFGGFLNWLNIRTPQTAPLLIERAPGRGAWPDAMIRVLDERGLASRRFARHQRAVYDATREPADYLNESMERKRRKEWRRLRRRLSEEGSLELRELTDGDDVSAWCEAFFALERAGWKGRAGTAMDCEPATRAIVLEAMAGEASRSRVGFWQLTLDGKPVAMAFALKRAGEMWLMKIAFDEAFARYSPGALLIFDIMEAASRDPDLRTVDSCAQPDHPMIDHIWRERLDITDVLIAGSATGWVGFQLRCGLETLRRTVRGSLKTLYHRFRRRRTK